MEKIHRFRKIGLKVLNGKIKKQLSIAMVIVPLITTGCGNAALLEKGSGSDIVSDTVETNDKVDFAKEGSNAEESLILTEESFITAEESLITAEESLMMTEDIAAVYWDIHDKVAEKNTSDSLEVMRSIVNRLGENGYCAVDSENRIDMVCPEQIKQFCGQVEAKEEAEASVIVVISTESFVIYEFTTKDGNVEVQFGYYLCREGNPETVSTKKYQTYAWVYSEEGYLFFEEYHMPGFDGPSGHTAVRVEPLDEMCRELTRKYLGTVGYNLNNLFTSDWSEDDFRELNFYDLYDVFLQMKSGQCVLAGFFEEGVTYEIPKSEFESTFQTFLRIDGQMLRQYTIYHEDTETYQYRERGKFDFAPTPNIPYPEVVSYKENQDGTIKLTVNAVWPEENRGKAFCHEVVVRPLEDGGFQYVSNHVIESKDNVDITWWYTERLSDDEWQEYYGEIQ